MAEETKLRIWRGTALPNEHVDGRVYYLYRKDKPNTFTIYVDMDGRRVKITDDNKFKLFTLLPDGWTGTATEGGREWVTQSLPVSYCYTEVIHAIACGETLDKMATEQQEKELSKIRGFLETDTNGDMQVVFYALNAPTITLYVGIEGVI